jgi:hypothetical protein
MKRVTAMLMLVGALTHAVPARAQSTGECEQQVTAIANALDEDARRSRVWYWSWMAAGTTLIASQAVLAGLSTGDLRNDSILGASASVFIPAVLLIHPPVSMADAPALHARLSLTTVDGHVGDPCISAMRARELLLRDAADEGFAKSWFAHAFMVTGNVALGLILGIGFGDWLGFAKQAVGGTIIGELQIWTLPGGALQARGLAVGGAF